MRDFRKFGTAEYPVHPSAIGALLECPWRVVLDFLSEERTATVDSNATKSELLTVASLSMDFPIAQRTAAPKQTAPHVRKIRKRK